MSTVEVPPPPTEDGLLVAAALAGDEGAQDRLFHLFHPRMVGYVRSRWISDPEEAAELVQSTWEKAIGALSTFDPSRPLWPWLKTIVDNTARNHRRANLTEDGVSRSVAVDNEVLDAFDHDGAEIGLVELQCAVKPALAALPARQREAFVGIELEGMTHSEMRERMGLKSNNAVRQLLHRARVNLREALDGLWGLGPLVWLQQAFGRARKALVLLGPEPAAGIAGVIGAVATLVIITGGIPDAEAGPSNTSPPPAIVSTQPADASPASSPPDATATPGGTNPAAGPSQPTATSTTTPAPPSTDGPPARDSHPEADVDIPATGVSAGTRSEQTPDHDYGVEIEQVGAPPVGNTSNDPNLRPLDATACTTAATLPGGYCHTP